MLQFITYYRYHHCSHFSLLSSTCWYDDIVDMWNFWRCWQLKYQQLTLYCCQHVVADMLSTDFSTLLICADVIWQLMCWCCWHAEVSGIGMLTVLIPDSNVLTLLACCYWRVNIVGMLKTDVLMLLTCWCC